MKRFLAAVIVLTMAFALVSCGGEEKVPEAKGDPTWKESGKPPISIKEAKVVTSLASVRTVEVTMENISNVPVTMIEWHILLFDDNGKFLEESESGYAFDTSMKLSPGETETAQSIIDNELASKVKVVIKSATYEDSPLESRDLTVPFVWENSNLQKELEEARK